MNMQRTCVGVRRAARTFALAMLAGGGVHAVDATPAARSPGTVDKLGGQTIAVPMPRFTPLPGANDVVCTPVKAVTLRGVNAGAGASVAGFVTGTLPRDIQHALRLRFEPGGVKVALGSPGEWSPDTSYAAVNEASTDYIAIRKDSADTGMLESLAMNRATGTAIVSTQVASMPSGEHPMASSTFYTCEPGGER